MEDIKMSQMTASQVIAAIETATSIEALRNLAKEAKVSFSGNTGLETLRQKLLIHFTSLVQSDTESHNEFSEPDFSGGDDDDIEIAVKPPSKPKIRMDMLKMNPEEIEDLSLRRQVIRAQALRLVRVRIQNLDPSDAAISGAIISLQNKYTGKISKFIPYGEETENGYHIPWMIYQHLKQWKFPLRKEQKGGRFGVKTYKTVMVNKFSIEILDPLTIAELRQLANHQRASQSIDNTA